MLLLLASATQAQDERALVNLVFDAVPIEISEDGSVRELLALPQQDPVSLRPWLTAARQGVPVADGVDMVSSIAAYDQRILEHELTGGPFDSHLDEELLALGSLLYQSGDFGRAQQVLQRALHVNRVNRGLFNLDQVPIIERTVQTLLARGDLLAADAQHEYLLYISRRAYGDSSVELLPALARYAEWSLFAFRARMVAQYQPQSDEEAREQEARLDENSDAMMEFRTGRLINAHNVYQAIIQILTSNFGESDSRLLGFERQLALTNYLFITTFGIGNEVNAGMTPMEYSGMQAPFFNPATAGRPPLGYRQGRDALERRVAYLQAQSDLPPLELAKARLDLADWYILFNKRVGSLELYTAAYAELGAAGVRAEDIKALFDPAVPIEIPALLDHSYSRESLRIPADLAIEYRGHLDVEFQLSRFGAPSSVTIIGKSPEVTADIQARLERNIRRAQFRPRFNEGVAREAGPVQLRYYYTY